MKLTLAELWARHAPSYDGEYHAARKWRERRDELSSVDGGQQSSNGASGQRGSCGNARNESIEGQR